MEKNVFAKIHKKIGLANIRNCYIGHQTDNFRAKRFGTLERKSSVCTISWVTLNNIYKHYLVPS